MDLINELRNWMDLELKEWQNYSKQLASFKELSQFLNVFSPEEVIEINTCEREIIKMSEGLAKVKNVVSTEDIHLFGIDTLSKLLDDSERNREVVCFFIENKRAETFKVRLSIWQLLFYPYDSARFLVYKCAHKIMMRRLSKY